MKKIIFIMIALFSITYAQKGDLVVGMELAYPPFEMSDTNGKASGVSVDFAKALGKYLNKNVIIENIAWDGLIPSLKTKKIDLVISSMTITKQREKTISFSIPYAQANLALLVSKKSNVNNIKDLNQKGKVIAVKKGSTGNIYALLHLKNAKVLIFDKESSAVLEVIQAKADAFIYDQLTIYRNWKKHQNETKALLAPFQETPEYWGVGLRKEDKELKKQIDNFITKAKSDGTFDKIADKYLGEVKKTFEEQNIDFFF